MNLVVRDILLSSFLVLASAAVMYVQYFASYALQQQVMWAWAVLLIAAFLFLMFSETGKSFLLYFKEAKNEIRKVVWPKRQDVVWTTFAVGVAVVIFSILVSMLDTFLVRVLSGLIG